MNVFESIRRYGDDGNFIPKPTVPTASPPGSKEKVELLRNRVLRGEELWHDYDETVLARHEQTRDMKNHVLSMPNSQREREYARERKRKGGK